MKHNASFQQIYKEIVKQPSPGTVFLKHISDITGRSKTTVYSWAIGSRQPDILAAEKIAKEYGCKIEQLFPNLSLRHRGSNTIPLKEKCLAEIDILPSLKQWDSGINRDSVQ